MTIESILQQRSGNRCELCSSEQDLSVYPVLPNDGTAEQAVYVCSTCREQLDNPDAVDANHWRCLNDSMWSQVPVVQVIAWRMLNRLRAEGWPQDLLDMMYLEEDTLAWAQQDVSTADDDMVVHKDCHGAILAAGDTVTLIKDLDVKGANFTAKRGTPVRGISLVADNAEHIEGRVNGQRIVILTQYVKKS